ncbi:MAG TPA: cyclic nucleotide-binding domain-containing protein [Usitatibacter sp.]|nr:cyclic nucleotide-binding domain-containing protein [Usitatibacter sp.]
MENLEQVVKEHAFFRGLDPRFVALLGDCAADVRFDAGAFLFREGDPANHFYLVREGRVALEMASPHAGPHRIQTLGAGEIVGLSWFVAPYRWAYDARALEPTRAVALDALCLRGKLDEDPALGYAVLQRFVPVLIERLQATRLQMIDVYANPGAKKGARR